MCQHQCPVGISGKPAWSSGPQSYLLTEVSTLGGAGHPTKKEVTGADLVLVFTTHSKKVLNVSKAAQERD